MFSAFSGVWYGMRKMQFNRILTFYIIVVMENKPSRAIFFFLLLLTFSEHYILNKPLQRNSTSQKTLPIIPPNTFLFPLANCSPFYNQIVYEYAREKACLCLDYLANESLNKKWFSLSRVLRLRNTKCFPHREATSHFTGLPGLPLAAVKEVLRVLGR